MSRVSLFRVLPDDVRQRLVKTMRIKEASIAPYSVFIDHGYLQNGGGEWQGKYGLRYHMYLVAEEVRLKDDIAFAYGNGLSIDPKADAEVGSKDREVVAERNMTDSRREDIAPMEAGVISDDD